MSYDPTSTEGVPEHGRERLAQMRGGFFTFKPSWPWWLYWGLKQAAFFIASYCAFILIFVVVFGLQS